MSLAYEKNTDLAYDTDVFRSAAKEYVRIADELDTMAKDLNNLLTDLKNNGWTTPAGTAFQEMVSTNWEDNIHKYSGLLVTLQDILIEASQTYDDLTTNHIEKVHF